PVASLGFLRSGRFSQVCALSLTLGGVLGTLCAFPLVNRIAEHLWLMRWFVIVVIIYAAVSMLRSARASNPASPDSEITDLEAATAKCGHHVSEANID